MVNVVCCMSIWKPESFDDSALFAAHHPRVAEGVLYLGHLVLIGLATNAKNRERGTVPLQTEYLRKVIGRHHWQNVKEAAKAVGYVACEAGYSVGRKSRAYSIRPPYHCGKLTKHHLSDVGFCLSIARWKEQRHREAWQRINRGKTLVAPEVCNYLWKNLQRLEIDDIKEYEHPAHQVAAGFIREKDLWFKVDDYGRIHTPVTNLPSVLRKNLTINGQRLANVDIGESQPLFLGLAASKAGKREGRRKGQAGGEGSPYVGHTYVGQEYLTSGGNGRGRLTADLREYLGLCESRRLYQSIADHLGVTRDKAKRSVMVAFYGKPHHQNNAARALGERFPTVMAMIKRIKKDDYRRLAHVAQQIESGFIFGQVVSRIMHEKPDMFVTTIHDSLLAPVTEAVAVRQVMLDEFAKLGVQPQIQIETGT